MAEESYVGRKVVKKLYEYNVDTGIPTGRIKDNIQGDSDYIPPVENSPECPIKYLYGNDMMQQEFVKNNCPAGSYGSNVNYIVPANKYKASSQVIANQLALNDIATNGQAYANANGTCTVSPLNPKWIPDPNSRYCEQDVLEEAFYTNFASPVTPFIRGENLLYLDRSLNKIITFNPKTLTQAQVGTVNAGGWAVPSNTQGVESRPVGWFYNSANDFAYVQGDFTGGVVCMRLSDGQIIKNFPVGSNGTFQRGEIVYIKDLNQIWATGNNNFLKIDLASNQAVTGGLIISGSVASVLNQNGKIYVVRDLSLNRIDVYNAATGSLIKSINNIASALNPNNNNYTIRGFYSDETNKRIYVGEVSSNPQVIVISTESDTIVNRILIPKETFSYGSVGVIQYNPVRQRIYVGGGIFSQSNASDSQARMWTLYGFSDAINEIIQPSANRNITDIVYYPPTNSVYVSSRGRVPQDNPSVGHLSDGVLFKFT